MSTPPAIPPASSRASTPQMGDLLVALVSLPWMVLLLFGSLSSLRALLSIWVTGDGSGLGDTVARFVLREGGQIAAGLLLAALLLYVGLVNAMIPVGPRQPTRWRRYDLRPWWRIGSLLWSALALLLAFALYTFWPATFLFLFTFGGMMALEDWRGILILVAAVLALVTVPLFPVAFLRQHDTAH
jgi:hypothetical protein